MVGGAEVVGMVVVERTLVVGGAVVCSAVVGVVVMYTSVVAEGTEEIAATKKKKTSYAFSLWPETSTTGSNRYSRVYTRRTPLSTIHCTIASLKFLFTFMYAAGHIRLLTRSLSLMNVYMHLHVHVRV